MQSIEVLSIFPSPVYSAFITTTTLGTVIRYALISPFKILLYTHPIKKTEKILLYKFFFDKSIFFN